MRPALAALVEQQQEIARLRQRVAAQEIASRRLARGIATLAELAGVDQQIRVAMLKNADVQNPGQPVPEPPAQPAPEDTISAKTPEAFADVTAPGLAPGTTNDVAADATTTAYTPGMDIAAPAFKQLVDVTAPVDGTQGPRPLNEVKTLTDVRVGDPMNPQVAFPLRGDFANAQRTSARKESGSNRMMAALRLARLRLQAGLVEGDDLTIANRIEKDASLSQAAIEQEIRTLDQVRVAASRRKMVQSARLVPRTASAGQRSTPSLQAVATSQAPVDADDASDLFD